MLTAFHPAHVMDVLGVLIVLRDMGNGVTRLMGATILDRALPKDVASLGFSPLSVPLTPRVADCVELALASLGARPPPTFTEGRVRPVCEDVTEFYIW